MVNVALLDVNVVWRGVKLTITQPGLSYWLNVSY